MSKISGDNPSQWPTQRGQSGQGPGKAQAGEGADFASLMGLSRSAPAANPAAPVQRESLSVTPASPPPLAQAVAVVMSGAFQEDFKKADRASAAKGASLLDFLLGSEGPDLSIQGTTVPGVKQPPAPAVSPVAGAGIDRFPGRSREPSDLLQECKAWGLPPQYAFALLAREHEAASGSDIRASAEFRTLFAQSWQAAAGNGEKFGAALERAVTALNPKENDPIAAVASVCANEIGGALGLDKKSAERLGQVIANGTAFRQLVQRMTGGGIDLTF